MARQFGMAEVKIRDVSFKDNYKINIVLDNGQEMDYDMNPKLTTARFSELADKKLFKSGIVKDGKRIYWNSATELTLYEIGAGAVY